MRKLVDPIADGGFPWGGEDILDLINTDIWDSIQAMLAVYDGDAQGVIVQGGVVTATADFDVTAAIVYLDGELYRLPAQTDMTSGWHIVPGATTFTQRIFQDVVPRNFVEVKTAAIQAGIPGGQYITVDSLTPRRHPDVREAILQANIDAEETARINADALKANIAQDAYTAVTFTNSWAQDADFPVGYYKDTLGRVYFRGRIKSDVSTGAQIQATGDIADGDAPPKDKSGAGTSFYEFRCQGMDGATQRVVRIVVAVNTITGVAHLTMDTGDYATLSLSTSEYIDLGNIQYDTREFA